MKKVSIALTVVALAAVLFTGSAQADAPFVNLEGVGGVGFNPLAYPAASAPKKGEEGLKIGPIDISKPRIGAWYVNLNDTDIDWFTVGIANTFAKRLELSYGYESVAIGGVGHNTHKSNLGAKALLLEENSFGTKYVPAISVGTIYKTTTFNPGANASKEGFDFYLVATKLITELPKPVLLSAGVLSTKGQVNGIIGFNDKRTEIFFANIDVIPFEKIIVGFEFKQGPKYNNYKDSDYWNVHAAYLVNSNLSLIAAYTNAGDRNSKTRNGLSDGPVLSMQYSF
jgi:hypothetical protein